MTIPFKNFSFLIAISLICYQCQPFEADNWRQKIEGVGSLSSPLAIDLNKDGIKDIVIGGGGKEFTPIKEAVIALDGKDGSILWTTPARNQVVGSAVFQDITQDGIPDIYIGGRSAILFALDGSNGQIIWEYLTDNDSLDYYNDPNILNFYSPQLIPDINKDGVADLLTAYGGFIKATTKDLDRPPGALMVFCGQTGTILAKAFVPDGKETYCSPIVHSFNNDGQLEVIFGTGGEYIDGGLFRVPLKDIINEDISNATLLASGNGKGFIAPPLIIDVDLDGIKDVVVNSVDGRLIAINGLTNSLLWKMQLEDTYDTYTMPAPGNFVGNDNIPDFFSSFGKGPWPNTEYTVHTLVNGKNGQLVFVDTLGTFQYASPVVIDLTDDGKEDILLAINSKVKSNIAGSNMEFLGNDLVIYSGGQGTPLLLSKTKLGTNLGSTPLLTDLDNDKNLDIITAYMEDGNFFYSFKNLIIEKQEFKASSEHIHWGNYMGKNGTSVYK